MDFATNCEECNIGQDICYVTSILKCSTIGTYRDTAHTSCVSCEDGYYQTQPGRDSCIQCPAGYYCPVSMVTIVNIF